MSFPVEPSPNVFYDRRNPRLVPYNEAMVKAVTVASLLFATLHVACSPFGGASAFSCDEDADCQGGAQIGGRCELSTSFCAFPDDACGSSGRYGALSGPLSNQCVDGSSTDAGVDAEPDGMPPDPDDVCFGSTGGLEKPCWAPADVPDQPVTLAAATIDTMTSNLCSTTVKNTTACVIAGSTISVSGGVTIRAIGAKPLVLVSTTGAVQIDGILDVASHITAFIDVGAGGNPATCDGGTAAGASAGGGGGSHGALGGVGGNGVGVMNSGGVPGAVTGAITTLRGGCKGQDGKEAGGGLAAQRGLGGNGGGAVYVIGKTAVGVGTQGRINASGSGATGAVTNSAGGGAGGSGGTIGIDTPTLTNTGQIFAHGGGGGAGAGANSAGGPGGDPTFTAAPGGTPAGNGEPGGPGGTTGAGGAGVSSATRGGGGGGGGGGIIRLFGGAAATGQISPGPT